MGVSMSKDFDSWNIEKKKAHHLEKRAFFHENEVWWCKLGINIGDEEDGKGNLSARPVLVLKKFNHNIFWGIPLTTQVKEDKHYHKFHFKGKEQCLLLSQLRLLDARRLVNKFGELQQADLTGVREKLKQLIC